MGVELFERQVHIYIQNENYLSHHSCTAVLYCVDQNYFEYMHAWAILTCIVIQICGPVFRVSVITRWHLLLQQP